MGRRTVLAPEVLEAMESAVRAGAPYHDAAEYATIAPSTHWSWISRGEREQVRLEAHPRSKPRPSEAPYVEYVERIKKARADFKVGAVSTVLNAAADHWQAAAWLLERSDPKAWGPPRLRLELGTDAERPIEVTVTHRDALAEELASLAERIAPVLGDASAPALSPLEEVLDLVPTHDPTD